MLQHLKHHTQTKEKFEMSKDLNEVERLQQENAQLRAKVTAYKKVVDGMNSFLNGDPQ